MEIRVYLWAGFFMALLFVCTKTLFLPMIFAVLILGVVPGTTVTIPAWVMLTIYLTLFTVVTLWFRYHSLLTEDLAVPATKDKAPSKDARKRLKPQPSRPNSALKQPPKGLSA